MRVRRINLLVCSLPLHRQSYIGFIFIFRFIDEPTCVFVFDLPTCVFVFDLPFFLEMTKALTPEKPSSWTPRVSYTMAFCACFSCILIVRLVLWPENCKNSGKTVRGICTSHRKIHPSHTKTNPPPHWNYCLHPSQTTTVYVCTWWLYEREKERERERSSPLGEC